MINMMQKLRKDVRADYAACVFDAKGPTFRDALYPEYKANRSPMPDDLRSQIPPIHEVVKLLGWRVLDVPGVEADDVIGTLAHTAAQQGIEVIISSGDKDLSQLVNEHITVIDTMNDRRRDVAGVEAEFGVPPQPDAGLPDAGGRRGGQRAGVPKVGPKTAVKWLLEYGSLDALVARARDQGRGRREPAQRPGLAAQGPRAADHQDRLRPGGPCGRPARAGRDSIGGQDSEALKAFSEKYGFKGLVKTLVAQETPPELIEEAQATRRGETGGLFDEPADTDQPPSHQPEVRHHLHLGGAGRLAGAADGG
jgi:DNA polymerase-1